VRRSRQASGFPLLSVRGRASALIALAACAGVTAGIGAWVWHLPHASSVDRAADPWIHDHLSPVGGFGVLGQPQWIALACVVLAGACLVTRRWRGAILAAAAVPLAGGLTEYALKPLFDRTLNGNLVYPSGHVTAVTAVAVTALVLLAGPARLPLPAAARWLLRAVALLGVVLVTLAVVGLHYHYFTDTIGGAAVGTGTVLGTALIVDGAGARLDRRRARRAAAPGTAAQAAAGPVRSGPVSARRSRA